MTDLPVPIPKDEIKDLAFQVWFLKAGKNVSRTRDLLLEGVHTEHADDPVPIDVPERTLRDWVRRYNWDDLADRRWRDLAPGIHLHVKQRLAFASLDAADWVADVAQGKIEKPDKVQATVALSLLDRTGHLPETRKNDGSLPTGPTRNFEESVAGLDTDALKKMLWGPPPDPEEPI